MRVALVLVLALAAGCLESTTRVPDLGVTPAATPGATPTPPATPSTVPTTTSDRMLSVRPIEQGTQSAITNESRRVVTDQGSWASLWREHSPDRAAPLFDFTSETAVAVFLGAKGNSCWATRIVNATEGAGRTTATIVIYAPPPNMMCASVITYPYDIVAIEGAGRAVEFREAETTNAPPPSDM